MQPQNEEKPSIDFKNPFYCPRIPPATYLKALRQKISNRKTHRPNQLFQAFARVLDRSFLDSSDSEDSKNLEYDWIIGPNLRARGLQRVSSSGNARLDNSDVLPPYSLDPRENDAGIGPSFSKDLLNLRGSNLLAVTKRKRTSPTDLERPPKYSRSIVSAHNSPFELEFCQGLNFDLKSSPNTLAIASSEHLIQPKANIDVSMAAVISILPGIRLEERLLKIPDLTIQKLADFLAENGHINPHVLEVLRTTDIKSLSLSASLSDEDGLNLCGRNLFSTFGKQDSFMFLSELSFTGSRVQDFDLVHVHHLPKLSALFLNNTGIGNEAVYLLVPLKHTLTKLSLATNPDIDSQSVPPMLLLSKLSFLSILDTSVDMVGLRTLAQTIFTEDRVMDIEIPFACETYIDNMHSMYLVNPVPPLITNPEVCSHMSLAALSRNLVAHAEKNPSIVSTGTHAEMVERLSGILRVRKMDLLVSEMLGNDSIG